MAKRMCCHPHCEREISKPHVLCLTHWGVLPERVQREMQVRIRSWRDDNAAREFYRSHQAALRRAEIETSFEPSQI